LTQKFFVYYVKPIRVYSITFDGNLETRARNPMWRLAEALGTRMITAVKPISFPEPAILGKETKALG
jgi:hypothetical protein